MSDPFLEERKSALGREIEGIAAELTKVAQSSRPQFPERYFREIFLPYFAGDEKRQFPTMDGAAWVARVAGSPFQEVDVISDQTRQVLFTVPALMDRSAVAVSNQTTGAPVAHIVKSAQQLRLMSPNMGEQHLRAELTKKALIMRVPEAVVTNLTTWNEIFVRYGRPPIIEVEQQQQPGPAGDTPTAAYDVFGGMELL